MNRVLILLALLCAPVLVWESQAQLQEPEASRELMNLIRIEKFDMILPQVMRDNEIDMWIYAKRGNDLLDFEFGDSSGIYIFSDRGDVSVERAFFGGRGDRALYSIIGAESDIAQFVAERDPKRIAMNYTERQSGYNTISEEDRTKLLEALGNKYSKRVVPGDRLTADFLAGRGMAEIALYGRLLMISSQNIENEFNKIVPGDGNEENNSDYVVQRGDLIGLLDGANMMDFSQHNGGIAYVLREGETDLPPEVKRIWNHALITREIFRKNIKAGPTGAETLEILIDKLEKAGYVYIDRDQYDTNADPEKTQVHIDFHGLGRIVSQEEAPRISATGWGRDLKIPLYHTFALEYMIHMPVPQWGRGKHLYICLHDGAVVTERGVEFPARPAQEIHIIR